MSASAESLHLLAHQAQLRARTEADWWDNPLDTALAAVSAARHPPAFRQDGEAAVQRMRRWLRAGDPRRISADAAALSLAASAAADLGLRDHGLRDAAVDAAADLAGRSHEVIPLLHIALIAWALDPLIPDREAKPWPVLRRLLTARPNGRGTDAAIAALADAFSKPRFPAAELVRELLSEVPTSPSLEDGSVLLWAMSVAIERSAAELGQSDSGFRALTDRRAEIALRLAQELDPGAFEPPEVVDFDPEADLDPRVPIFLSPTEALLLDVSLASREQEPPFLRFEEAAQIFSEREHKARRDLASRTVVLLSALGVMTGALVAVVLGGMGSVIERGLAIPAGVAVASAMLAVASVVGYRFSGRATWRALVALFLTLTFCAGLGLINSSLSKPLLSDAAGVIVGLLIPVVVALGTALVSDRRRRV